MFTATERLMLIISADAKGAIAGLNATGAAARQNLPEVERRAGMSGAALMRVGTVSMLAGAATAAGLNTAVQATAQLNDTAGFSRQVFGPAAADIEKFGAGAAKSIGQSKQQAIEASTGFAMLGKQAGLSGEQLVKYSTDLVKFASDMKAAKGGTIDEALTALMSGISGTSVEPLRRYGILLDDLSIKQEAVNLGLRESTTGVLPPQMRALAAQSLIMKRGADIAGQYGREYDQLPARQERLRASLENIKTEIGEGALPAFEAGTRGLEMFLDMFNRLPDVVQGGVGIAGVALAGTAVIGGAISNVVGGYRALQDANVSLKSKIGQIGPAGELSFGRLGTAARLAGGVLAAAGISEAIFGIVNQIHNMDREGTDALNRLATTAKGTGDKGGLAAQFGDLVKVQDDTLKMSHIWTDFGERFQLAGAGVTRSAADMHAAFDLVLSSQGPEAAQATIDALRASTNELDHNSDNYRKSTKILDEWQSSVDAAKGAQDAATGSIDAATGAIDSQTGSVDANKSAWERRADALKASTDPVFGMLDAQRRYDDATRRVKEAEEALGDARKGTGKDLAAYQSALDSLTSAQERYNDSLEDVEKLQREMDFSKAVLASIDKENNPNAWNQVAFAIMEGQEKIDDAQRRSRDAARGLTQAQGRLSEVQGEGASQTRDLEKAERDLQRAREDQVKAARDLEVASATLNDEVSKNPALFDEFSEALKRWLDQGLITKQMFDDIALSIFLTRVNLQGLAGDVDEFTSRPSWTAGVPWVGGWRPSKQDPTPNDSVPNWGATEQQVLDQQNAEFTRLSKEGQTELANWLIGLSVREYANWKQMMGEPIVGAPARAQGGVVSAGSPARVGEWRPELFQTDAGHQIFIPPERGRIIPRVPTTSGTDTAAVRQLVAELGRQGVTVEITQHNYGIDPNDTAAASARGARDGLFLAGITE